MSCTTTQVRTPSMDRHFSRNSNTAGAPLPLIPRRSSSFRAHTISPTSSPAPTTPCRTTKFQAQVKVQPPTPPETVALPTSQNGNIAVENSESSSSSLSSDPPRPTIARRSKRILGQRFPTLRPPEFSTPTPAVLNAKAKASKRRPSSAEDTRHVEGLPMDSDDDETPRPLYSVPLKTKPVPPLQDFTIITGVHSNSPVDPSELAESSSFEIPRLIRKKSGQPVKSSLKSVKSPSRGSLSVFTHGISSKSEPNTPTHAKAVHFDSHLEHVKLFLAEQKPLAVSRDGSPTDDTSGTDTDFPPFIFGNPDEDIAIARRSLLMEVTNLPPTINSVADVALEELKLSEHDANIVGTARVRNIAFQKWLAVRFTFDLWQTTSEVTAKYVESIGDDGAFDRFSFTIKLNDMLPRIGGKTLVLALRYTVGGREIWDNNNGENYLATFTKTKSRPDKDDSPEAGDSARNDIADLKCQLEKVVQAGDGLGQRSRRNALTPEGDRVPALKEGTSLAARYDFPTSLKSPWKLVKEPSPPRHSRTKSYPSHHSSPSSIPWPPKNALFKEGATADYSSERARGVVSIAAPPRDIDSGSKSEQLPFPSPTQVRESRHHQRGYIDQGLMDATGIKKTPIGNPLLTPSRFYSFPPVERNCSSSLQQEMLTPTRSTSYPVSGQSDGDSADSTPSMVSPSDSSPTSPSSTDSFLDHLACRGNVADEASASPSTDYHQFLNKFCFFTGTDSLLDTPTESISRSHSASSVEGFLLTQSPRSSFLSQFTTPTRTPSYDDIVSRSGSSTPTARNFGTFESRSVTAVK